MTPALLALALASAAFAADAPAASKHAPKPAPSAKAAGSVVRSKEWVVRRGKSREEEFVGDVRYDSAGTRLTADWALYRQETDDWQARGKIYARRELKDGSVVEARGEKAWHEMRPQEGRLEAPGGRVTLLRTPTQGAPDHADGDRLSWHGQEWGILAGRARGWGPRGEFWAETARYDRTAQTRRLTLSGSRPVLHDYSGGSDAAVKADQIVADETPRRAVATGRVQGWIIAQSTSAPKTGPSAVLCGQGPDSTGPGRDEKVTALLAPLSPADDERRFRDAEAAAFADRACPWGPRVRFWADRAEYEQVPARALTLSGGRPVLHKLDPDRTSAIKADVIVAREESKLVTAEGRVRGWIVFDEHKKPSRREGSAGTEKAK